MSGSMRSRSKTGTSDPVVELILLSLMTSRPMRREMMPPTVSSKETANTRPPRNAKFGAVLVLTAASPVISPAPSHDDSPSPRDYPRTAQDSRRCHAR